MRESYFVELEFMVISGHVCFGWHLSHCERYICSLCLAERTQAELKEKAKVGGFFTFTLYLLDSFR